MRSPTPPKSAKVKLSGCKTLCLFDYGRSEFTTAIRALSLALTNFRCHRELTSVRLEVGSLAATTRPWRVSLFMVQQANDVRLHWFLIYCLGALAGTIISATAAENINHRTRVDISAYPWSSVGKIYNGTGSACTGSLVGPNKVLTAAHCIFNARTRRFIRPELIHFLLGYEGGRYRANVIIGHYEIGPGYDPAAVAKNLTSDWAVLTISTLVGEEFRPLELADAPLVKNAPVMLPGFAQDHAFVVTADTDCHIVGMYEGGSLIVSDCVALHGDSGAPMIGADADGKFHVVGVQTAIAQIGGVSRSIAIAATSPGLYNAVSRH
jgi:protease YdgD